MKFKEFYKEREDRLLEEILTDLELVTKTYLISDSEMRTDYSIFLTLYLNKYESDVIAKSGCYRSTSDLFKKVYQGIKNNIINIINYKFSIMSIPEN